MAYIDTSLLVAYYCPEPLSRSAQQAIRRAAPPTISPLVEVEFYSAVATKVRTGDLDEATAVRIVTLLARHLAEGRYSMVALTAADYGLARDWIGRFSTPLRAPDALHLAAAVSNELTLLTADRQLAASAKHFDVKHKLIS